MSAKLLIIGLILLLPRQLFAAALEYHVEGVDDELQRNVQAWLGQPPATPQERLNFMTSVLERSEKALQALGHYQPDIDLLLERTEPTWQLRVLIEAGPPVLLRDVDIQVFGEAADDEAFQALLAELPLHAGETLHHGRYEAFKRQLLSLGQLRGYFDGELISNRVQVEPVGGIADISLHYHSGSRYRFGALEHDETHLEPELLAPLLKFNPGEHFDQGLVQASQAMLQRTGYFSTVLLRPQLEQAQDGVVPMELKLYPATRHSFDAGVGWSTDTRERVSMTWRTPRINRYGHSQETRLQYSSINPSGRITYTIPLGHPLRDILQLGARLEDNEFGDLDSSQEELSVRREQRLERWVFGYSLRGLDESWVIEGDHLENDYLLPGFSLSRRDHSGSAVNPDSGFSQLYQLEVASSDLGSDVDLVRATANFGYITSLGERHRLVSRLELGAALISDRDRAKLAPSLNFFAGGSQSIRGFSYQSIGNEITIPDEEGGTLNLVVGGERLLTGSVEYQYRVNENWRGALFVDGGDAFDEGEFDFNYAAGFGVHYITPVGAVRLEFANPLSKDDPSWRFHLAIGAEF